MRHTANDHRTRVTKLLIRRAFLDLLGQKPIQSITVKELCAQAGINRGTFYSHYTDIYDLLGQMEAGFQKELEGLLSGQEGDPVKVTTSIYQFLKDNADFCAVTLGEHGDKAFAARERSMDSYARYFQGASPQQIDEFFAFVSGGHIALLQKWVSDGMAASAEEMAATAENIMLYGIGFLRNNTPPERKNIP